MTTGVEKKRQKKARFFMVAHVREIHAPRTHTAAVELYENGTPLYFAPPKTARQLPPHITPSMVRKRHKLAPVGLCARRRRFHSSQGVQLRLRRGPCGRIALGEIKSKAEATGRHNRTKINWPWGAYGYSVWGGKGPETSE